MKKLAISVLCALAIAGCRPKTAPQEEGEVTALQTGLSLETDFKSLPADSCLVEVSKNFKVNETKSVGSASAPQCLPTKSVSFRGRLDVESTSSKLKPISVALMVDNSVSLKATDPSGLRFGAVNAFLDALDKTFAANPKMLRLQIVYFSYCGANRFRFDPSKGMAALKADIGRLSRTPTGATNYLDALKQTREWIMLAPQSEAHVVLFSDGMPFALNNQIPDSCSIKVDDVPSLRLDSADLAQCGGSELAGKCEEPGVEDKGFAVKSRPAWDDPTNYAIGMRGHVEAFASLSKLPQVKKVDSVYLNGGCYEQSAATSQGDAKRAQAFAHLCNSMASQFFTTISTGKSFQINNAGQLKDRLVDVSETIVRQIGFQKVEANIQGEKVVGRAYRQAGEADSYDFEIPSRTLKVTSGKAVVSAYENAADTSAKQVQIDFNFSHPQGRDASVCPEFKTVNSPDMGDKTYVVSSTKADYRITCRVTRQPQGCITQSGVKVNNGEKEILPGYSKDKVAFGRTCKEVENPRSRVCQDGTWSAWTGGPFTTCSEEGPAACGAHPHNSEWQGDVVYYEKAKVSAGSSCKGERDRFKCNNGNVVTVYKSKLTLTRCEVETHQNCGSVPHGGKDNKACYKSASVRAPLKCEPFYRTCNEGKFEPASCPYNDCKVETPVCTDSNGNKVQPGGQQTRVRYRQAQVPYGGKCEQETQARRCEANGVWSAYSGSFLYESCDPGKPPPPPPPQPSAAPSQAPTVPPVVVTQPPPPPPPPPESEVMGEMLQ